MIATFSKNNPMKKASLKLEFNKKYIHIFIQPTFEYMHFLYNFIISIYHNTYLEIINENVKKKPIFLHWNSALNEFIL